MPNIGTQAVQVDAVAAPGTPGTVTLPSGHVLSVPAPEKGEGFMGYFQRVSAQTGGDPNQALAAAQGAGPDAADPANWPLIADKYANPAAYYQGDSSVPHTPSAGPHTAKDAQQAAIAAKLDASTLTENDTAYLIANGLLATSAQYLNGAPPGINKLEAGNIDPTQVKYDDASVSPALKAVVAKHLADKAAAHVGTSKIIPPAPSTVLGTSTTYSHAHHRPPFYAKG